ncbi:helix-turn-helix domain-containing protein [Limosilactobacillus fermentum]|uniref:helix-turn-helix domain-containing protein n=1 Tax=Limosilactobacillus fermentum TaxID=1613 RepID=UPI0021A7F1EA|nr:helix-turn-helix domain-containing protein [Limosilactobacillus fermentum]
MNPNFDGVKYFLNIPAFVAHDSRLKDPEKLLFGEIFSMLNTTGKFFMNNQAISIRMSKSVVVIQRYLSDLERIGYIKRSFVLDEDTKVVTGRFIQLGDEYFRQYEKMKQSFEKETLANEIPDNSSVVSLSDYANTRGGNKSDTGGGIKNDMGGGIKSDTGGYQNRHGGGIKNDTYNRTILREHTKRTTTPPLPPNQVDSEQGFGNDDDGVVENDSMQSTIQTKSHGHNDNLSNGNTSERRNEDDKLTQPQSDQGQSSELRFKRLWAKYPAKIGYNEAFAAYKDWIKASQHNTDEYLDKQLDKYLQHLAMNQWLIAMKPQKWFGGGFQDDYSYYDQAQPSQGATGRKQGGRIKEQLPQWAQNKKQQREQVTPEQIAQAKEALAKLRSADHNQQEKR